MWVLLYLSCQTTLPNPAEFNQKGVNGGYGWWRGWRLITCITDGRPMGNTRSAVSSLLCYCSPLKGQQVRWSNCWKKPWQCSVWIRWWVAAAANLRLTINPPDLIGRKILHLFKNAPHLQLKCILNLFFFSKQAIEQYSGSLESQKYTYFANFQRKLPRKETLPAALFFTEPECGDKIVRFAAPQKPPRHCYINLCIESQYV